MEGIGVEIFANFLERMICSHQFAAVGKINTVDARIHVRRATDEDVNFFRVGFFKVVDARFASGAAHDGIVDDDYALIFDEFGDEIELHANVEIADELGRLKKAAANVMVANEGHFERNAGFERIAKR